MDLFIFKSFFEFSNDLSGQGHVGLGGVDPVGELGNFGVDTGVVGTGTSVTPGDNTDKGVANSKRATRVSLARVPTTGGETGAEHGVQNVGGSVGLTADGVSDDGNGDLSEGSGDGATFGGGAPAGDNGVTGSDVAGGWNVDGPNVGVQGKSAGQAHDGNIVGEGVGIVAGVDGNLSNALGLFRTLVAVQVVLTGNNGEGAGGSNNGTMGSSDDVVGIEDRSPTDVAARVAKTQLVGEFMGGNHGSSDDLTGQAIEWDSWVSSRESYRKCKIISNIN